MDPSQRRDYYEVLGVPRDADSKAIKDSFRKLALQYHPDRNKEPDAEARFKEIAEAYAVLCDPKKRAGYDQRGFSGVSGFSAEDLFGGIDFEDLLRGHGFDPGFGTGGLFESFFGRRRKGPAQGAHVEVPLEVALRRVVNGGEETVHVARPQTCPACKGSGAENGTALHSCEACGGRGQKVSRRQETQILVQQISSCGECRGRGSVIEKPCPDCTGKGQIESHESLTVKIPVGVEEGTALRVPGRGLPSPEPGGPPGDLYVVVRTAPDPRFERRGSDLLHVETVGVADVVLGTKLQVPTLEAPVTVKIQHGTQPGTVVRLRGKGLPEFGGGRRGDLYVAVQVHVPEKLSAEEQRLYESLRSLQRESGSA
jgi:molecular chaperone DnaJ